ncbi:hypothetical protein [Candidatus Tokpelaia sp.]|uniref:hypothetical protein n=1 Tax=Candidatus Tokpelaia sp. TaxID=2233777 RepID=UPI00123B54AA|nr:hypothetical protein [Candidatus Tokpelaia sp.]KAA6405590.1 hypothetical protein DPQ22_03925 [Candidatus Tokpelaia sp.]
MNLQKGFEIALMLIGTALRVFMDYRTSGTTSLGGIVWYDTLLIYLPAVLLFSIIRGYEMGQKACAIAGVLSAAAYSLYLWHLMIVHCAVWLKSKQTVPQAVLDAGAVIAAFGLGIILYKLLHKSKLNRPVRG